MSEPVKVAYISSTAFSDVDISYVKECQKLCNIWYFILVTPSGRKNAAIDLKKCSRKDGIYCGDSFDELKKYKSLIDLKRTFVVYYNSDKGYSVKRLFTNLKLWLMVRRFNVLHFTWPLGYSLFLFYTFRSKILLTVHDPIPHSGTSSKRYLLERFLSMFLLKYFVLLNKKQKKDFVDYYGIDEKKQKVFVSSLGCYDYLSIYDCCMPTPRNYILFFGKIFPYKGLDILFPAMKKVHEVNPDVQLVVAGSGTLSFDFSEYKDLPYITFLNRFIPDEELVCLIKKALFIVLPYKDATQSGVVMSAFALDKPCLVTNVGGLAEMVVDQQYGVVVEPNKVDVLADTIVKLVNSPKMVEFFSNNIQCERKKGMFSWKKISEQMIDVYNVVGRFN